MFYSVGAKISEYYGYDVSQEQVSNLVGMYEVTIHISRTLQKTTEL